MGRGECVRWEGGARRKIVVSDAAGSWVALATAARSASAITRVSLRVRGVKGRAYCRAPSHPTMSLRTAGRATLLHARGRWCAGYRATAGDGSEKEPCFGEAGWHMASVWLAARTCDEENATRPAIRPSRS